MPYLSLVFGTRRPRSLLLALALALGGAALLAVQPSVPQAAAEPLSLILLGVGFAVAAYRLRAGLRASRSEEPGTP